MTFFRSCFITAYKTTIKTSTNGIAAAAGRDTKKRAAPDKAAPVKISYQCDHKKQCCFGRTPPPPLMSDPPATTDSPVLFIPVDFGWL